MTCLPTPRCFKRFAPEKDISFVAVRVSLVGVAERTLRYHAWYNIVVAHVVCGKVNGIAADPTAWVES